MLFNRLQYTAEKEEAIKMKPATQKAPLRGRKGDTRRFVVQCELISHSSEIPLPATAVLLLFLSQFMFSVC